MPDFETRISALEHARKDIEDAMIVMAHLEKTNAEMAKRHAEYILTHDDRLKEHERRLREDKERGRSLDKRISDLVSAAIGEMLRKE
jgi:hypothetical protein